MATLDIPLPPITVNVQMPPPDLSAVAEAIRQMRDALVHAQDAQMARLAVTLHDALASQRAPVVNVPSSPTPVVKPVIQVSPPPAYGPATFTIERDADGNMTAVHRS